MHKQLGAWRSSSGNLPLSLGLGDRNGNPDLTIITLRSRMQRENRVTADIRGNGLFGRRLGLHQLVAVVEHRFHYLVDEVVGQIFMRDGKIEETHRLIVASEGGIRAGRNGGPSNFRYFFADCGDLLGGGLDEVN